MVILLKTEVRQVNSQVKRLFLLPPFTLEKSVIQRGNMLHTIDRPMQLIHADVADLHFFSKLAVAPKYYLAWIDLFTLKTYTYGMKKKPTIRQVRKSLFWH